MNACAELRGLFKKLKLLVWLGLLAPSAATAASEETFDVLQIGPRTYQNVTVTTKARDYIFIMHAAGMSNIKVSELSQEVRNRLGYTEDPEKESKGKNRVVSSWAKSTLSKMEVPQIKQLSEKLRGHAPAGTAAITFNFRQLIPLLAILAAFYLLFCYCSMLICQKTGNEAGIMIWIPVLQLMPLLRAAGMSRGWFIAFLLPIVNLVGFIVWATNIAQARNKSGWVALFLILPVTNLIAYLYLAFSSGTPRRDEYRRIEVMALEVA